MTPIELDNALLGSVSQLNKLEYFLENDEFLTDLANSDKHFLILKLIGGLCSNIAERIEKAIEPKNKADEFKQKHGIEFK